MNEVEHLTEVVGEECSEVAQECTILLLHIIQQCNRMSQRTSKANRFGMVEIQDRHFYTNLERIRQEYWDLQASLDLLGSKLDMPMFFRPDCVSATERTAHMEQKKEKVLRYMESARKNGTLT